MPHDVRHQQLCYEPRQNRSQPIQPQSEVMTGYAIRPPDEVPPAVEIRLFGQQISSMLGRPPYEPFTIRRHRLSLRLKVK